MNIAAFPSFHRSRLLLLLGLLLGPAGQACADELATKPPGVRTRNIVRRMLPPEAKSIALEYTIVALDGMGAQKTVDPEQHLFSIGDSFLVKVRPQDDVYVYIFTEGPDGKRMALMPDPENAAEQPSLVQAGEEVLLPDDGSWFEFHPPAGTEKLVVVALAEPSEDLQNLALVAFQGPVKKLSTDQQLATAERVNREINSLRDRANRGVRTRGPVRKQGQAVAQEFDKAKTYTVIEPPSEEESSTYALGVAAERPELILDIPLRSREAEGR